MWVAGMALVSGFAMTVAASQWWSTPITSVALGAAALGRPLRTDRAARPEELRHQLGLEPRDHGPAPGTVACDRACRWAADEPGDLQRFDQRPAQQDDDGPHPPGDERDHASVRREDRSGAEGDRSGAEQGGQPPAAGHEQQIPLRVRSRRGEVLADPQARLRPLLQTRRPPGGHSRGGAEERAPGVRSDDRRRPAQDRSAGKQPRPRRSQTGSRRSKPTATSSPDRRRSSRSRSANPAVKKYVEFFLAFLIAIDLVALVLKLTHLLSTGGAYERSGAALRAMDVVEAHRLQERAAVLTRRITLEARAQEDADELRIRGEVKRRPVSEEPRPVQRADRRSRLGGPAAAGPLGD